MGKPRRAGRHADAETVVVRLTDPAVADLHEMQRKGDPQVVRWALKKCLLLERDPEAGDELRGSLIGFRKITVGDRGWRVVWRVTHDEVGRTVVDVAEVWAVGARSDADVYDEMNRRVATLRGQPHTIPLAEALESLGRTTYGLVAASEPVPDRERIPEWLVHALVAVVEMPRDEVAKLSQVQAEALWTAYTTRPRR